MYHCVDPMELEVYGSFGSDRAQQILIDVVKCSKIHGVECKSDEEIEEYFRGKIMYILSNQIRFDF